MMSRLIGPPRLLPAGSAFRADSAGVVFGWTLDSFELLKPGSLVRQWLGDVATCAGVDLLALVLAASVLRRKESFS